MLQQFISQEISSPVDPAITALGESIKNKMSNSDGLVAILLYGSGLWQEGVENCVWDLYVIVDHYKDYQPHIGLQIAGSLLAPNVYFTQEPLSCKYAIMRLDQLQRGASDKALKPQIWARFSQPCRLIYARDEQAKNTISEALSECVLTFHKRALPFTGETTDARSIWLAGLNETYGSELRSENPERARHIFDAAPESFTKRTTYALAVLPKYKQPRLFWIKRFFRRPFIKILYFIQLMKAVFTFQNSVDYALWKIKRHSGIDMKASDFQRKYPLIGAWPLLWKIYRAGGLR